VGLFQTPFGNSLRSDLTEPFLFNTASVCFKPLSGIHFVLTWVSQKRWIG
jgi:hypothetical protein